MTAALSPGARVGNYMIVSQLGEGGTSRVYRATHAHVGREVALKVLGPDYPKSRFLAEARAIGSIASHPNIVEIYDCGKTDHGQLYYVMELLQGCVMSQVIGGRLLTPAEALPYLEQVCAGLAAAHRMGVVHRDVKAANIFVLDGEPLRLKLFDFGVARLPELLTADMGSTSQGVVIGTPTSMSPEQAAGTPERVGPPTDIYAVGVLLYQTIAGRAPFDAQDVATLLASHINNEPPPLAELALVSTALSDVALRCLQKDPADRYQSAEELYQAFSDVVNAELAEQEDAEPAKPSASISERSPSSDRPSGEPESGPKPEQSLDLAKQLSPNVSASWSDGIELPSDAEHSGPFEMQRLPTGALQQLARPDTRDDGSSHRVAWIGGIVLLLLAGGAWFLLRDSDSGSTPSTPDVAVSPAPDSGPTDSRPFSDASAVADVIVDTAIKRAPDLAKRKVRKPRKPRRKPRRRKPPRRTVVEPPPPAPDTGPPPTVVPPAGKVIGVEPGK